jgi:hypothetical protein
VLPGARDKNNYKSRERIMHARNQVNLCPN